MEHTEHTVYSCRICMSRNVRVCFDLNAAGIINAVNKTVWKSYRYNIVTVMGAEVLEVRRVSLPFGASHTLTSLNARSGR